MVGVSTGSVTTVLLGASSLDGFERLDMDASPATGVAAGVPPLRLAMKDEADDVSGSATDTAEVVFARFAMNEAACEAGFA
jgi:hypothetical protein